MLTITSRLLAAGEVDQRQRPAVEASWHSLEKEGWPSGDKLGKASTIIIYADGGAGHPFKRSSG